MPRPLFSCLPGLLAWLALSAGPSAVCAQPDHDPAAILRDASLALDDGQHQRAADLARGVLANPNVPAVDRTEAWRIYGLASFFLDRFAAAEAAFLEYLKLDVDGRLDPALVPPEALVFFEAVRARHAADLRQYRPKLARRRYWALNLIPPAGQFQNGHRGKAWLLSGVGGTALATSVATFLLLTVWCDNEGNVCRSGQTSRTDIARVLKPINEVSFAVTLSMVAYGIVDGFVYYGSSGHSRISRSASFQLCPALDCGYVSLQVQF